LLKCKGAAVESAISAKGQATIPKAIREYLHLGPGDRIKFFLHPDGTVAILQAPRIAAEGNDSDAAPGCARCDGYDDC
jgi:AbrB family looped-hinge helix DNA binding protein